MQLFTYFKKSFYITLSLFLTNITFSQVSENSNNTVFPFSAPVSFSDAKVSKENPLQSFRLSGSSRAFGINLILAQSVKLNLSNTSNLTNFGAATSDDIYAGDMTPNGWYVINTNYLGTDSLLKIDTVTGVKTFITQISGKLPGHVWSGLTWDASTNRLYASSALNSQPYTSALYTLNSITGVASLIGTIFPDKLVVDIASSNGGDLYGYEIITSNIFRINKNTGAGTIIGNAGFAGNYAQGMDFDPVSDSLYLASCRIVSQSPFQVISELRSVNLTTGLSSIVQTIGAGVNTAEIDAFTITGNPVTSISENENLSAEAYTLSQNYPNPFNPSTVINYSLLKSENVKLKIYNMLGVEVMELVNARQYAGSHRVEFNGTNLAGGVYFYTLSAGEFTQTKKMMLVK